MGIESIIHLSLPKLTHSLLENRGKKFTKPLRKAILVVKIFLLRTPVSKLENGHKITWQQKAYRVIISSVLLILLSQARNTDCTEWMRPSSTRCASNHPLSNSLLQKWSDPSPQALQDPRDDKASLGRKAAKECKWPSFTYCKEQEYLRHTESQLRK